MIRYLLIALALLCAPIAHARPVVWGGTPCTQDGTDTDGCYNGGAIQVPNFFTGYAVQSAGVSYPPTPPIWGVVYPASASVQPASGAYPARPAWNVAGVDYGVGLPRWQMPTVGNLYPAWLKDPALIASDALVNPDGNNVDCQFYASNSAAPGGVVAGTTTAPYPAPLGGPSIVCSHTSTHQIIFDGYNFSWNSSTGFGCVPVYFKGVNFGTAAAQNSAATAAVIVRNSLLVNGPNCNIWGGVYQGPGTSIAGPQQAGSFLVYLASGTGIANSFAFVHNTVYGCAGDPHASALETALCSQTFNATSYNAGSITGWVSGATVGVAPVSAHALNDTGGASSWVEYNAFIHMTSRTIDWQATNVGSQTYQFDHNYSEGLNYLNQPYVLFSSIVCTANCSSPALGSPTTELITATAPHGIPVGGWYAFTLSPNNAIGFPPSWAGTWSVYAVDATHLQINSITNPGDWTWSGTGNYANLFSDYPHGEQMALGASTTSATFQGSVSGTTLTVSSLTSGTIAVGQALTANGNIDAAFNGTINGNTLTINSLTSGTVAVGQYVAAAAGSGITVPGGLYITAGSGSTWTLNQTVAASPTGNMTGAAAIPTGTIITAGSGSTWTINTSLTVAPTTLNSLYYVPTAQGGTTTFNYSYNTFLQPAAATGWAETSVYYTGGVSFYGVPLQTMTGSIDHNIFVENLSTSTLSPHVGFSVSAAAIDRTAFSNVSVTNNWIDPTGAGHCWQTLATDPSSGLTMSGNVNLLTGPGGDPYINQPDSISIVPYAPGNATTSQAENGIAYNPSTGVVTVTLSFPSPVLTVGTRFYISNAVVSQGTNYLAGNQTVASISGTTMTFNSGVLGATGIPVSSDPSIIVYQPGGITNTQTCYGHN